jgi:hypothetical protein
MEEESVGPDPFDELEPLEPPDPLEPPPKTPPPPEGLAKFPDPDDPLPDDPLPDDPDDDEAEAWLDGLLQRAWPMVTLPATSARAIPKAASSVAGLRRLLGWGAGATGGGGQPA